MKKNWLNNIVGTQTGRAWSLVIASAVLNIGLWILVRTTFPSSTPAAVLHYSVGVGVDFIGEGQQIIMLPLSGSLLIVLNGLAAYVMRRASWAASWILLSSTALLQILLIIAYVYILQLNI